MPPCIDMPDRRRVLALLLAVLAPLPAAPPRAAPQAGARLVGGWVLTDRDLAAIARLDR
jgi:hypothetical protein